VTIARADYRHGTHHGKVDVGARRGEGAREGGGGREWKEGGGEDRTVQFANLPQASSTVRRFAAARHVSAREMKCANERDSARG
jgi:hypothetical protein